MSEYKGWKIECLEDLDIPKDNKLRELGKDSHRFHITHYNYYGDGYISKPFEDFNQVKNYVSNNFGAFIYIYK